MVRSEIKLKSEEGFIDIKKIECVIKEKRCTIINSNNKFIK